MSDNGEVAAETSAPIPSIFELTPETALQQVLKNALIHDGLRRGIREVAKALDSKTAQLCVLAESCDEKAYTKLIEALCKSRGIKLIKVKDKKTLGEWSGLCKIDKEGNPRKVVAASSVAITEFGPKTPAQDMVMESAQFVQ